MAASSEVRERWQELIEEYAQSGETVAAWCQFNNVAVHSFYYWKKRLSIRAPECATHPGIQWLSMDSPRLPNADQTNIYPTSTPPVAASSLTLPASSLTLNVGSICVQVESGFDPSLLHDVLTVLVRHGSDQHDLERQC